MICPQCKEQLDVGEACKTLYVEGRQRFFHTGCFARYTEESANEDAEFERIANQARLVC